MLDYEIYEDEYEFFTTYNPADETCDWTPNLDLDPDYSNPFWWVP
jgi:hypothetical protein